jgi:hypothetical protein
MTLIGLLALVAYAVAMMSGLEMQDYFLEALPAPAILFLVWGILRFRQAYLQNREKLRRGPMSRDELRVARSKLRNGMKPNQRPAPRAPDTNLKY